MVIFNPSGTEALEAALVINHALKTVTLIAQVTSIVKTKGGRQ